MEGRRRLLLLLLLAAVGGGAGEEAEEREELYHQLGEPAVVTVVTATTGKPELARCIESVRAQQYHGVCGGRIAPSSLPFISSYRTEKSSWRTGAIQHLVVVDGERFAAAARAVIAALDPPASPSPPYASCPEAPHVKNSPCGAAAPPPEGGGPGPRWLDVVFLPFNMHGDGGRVYAGRRTCRCPIQFPVQT